MKVNPEIIEALNKVLTNELTAINQYFLHARMCKDWGYEKLASKIHAESIDEMKHASQLVDRILYLDGIPNLQRLGKLNIGENVKEQLKADLELENTAIPDLRDGIEACFKHNDHGTRELLEHILTSEEEHVDWIESQMHQIEELGYNNYLTTVV